MHRWEPVGCEGSGSTATNVPSSTTETQPQRERHSAQNPGIRSVVMRAPVARSRAEPGSEIKEVFGHDGPLAFRRQVCLLGRTVFGRPRDKRRVKTVALGGTQVVVVRGH